MALTYPDPLYNPLDSHTQEAVRRNVIFNNLFVGTPFMDKLRVAGVFDPFLGGSAMVEPYIYGRPQGAAVAPGSTVTVTRQQMNTLMNFKPKAYSSWLPIDDWELDDGSGTGGVINSGPAVIIDQYQVCMELMTEMVNTMLEMDAYRHGQPSSSTVFQNRILNSNGLAESLNNGIDPSWDGNSYVMYGGNIRNGVIGMALNATPLWVGNSQGGVGQLDFAQLMRGWGATRITGGKANLGITNVGGFVAIAVALDAQRRDISNTQHDINWEGLNFNGIDIYADPLAPSSSSSQFLSLQGGGGIVGPSKSGNNTLVDGAGSNTVTGTIQPTMLANPTAASRLPNATQAPNGCTVGEVLFILTAETFKIRPTNKRGWDFGTRRMPVPNNISVDAMFLRLGINLYCVQPRQNTHMYGFTS
jgi:hypothetical protein